MQVRAQEQVCDQLEGSVVHRRIPRLLLDAEPRAPQRRLPCLASRDCVARDGGISRAPLPDERSALDAIVSVEVSKVRESWTTSDSSSLLPAPRTPAKRGVAHRDWT
jgi:hypothetical protein